MGIKLFPVESKHRVGGHLPRYVLHFDHGPPRYISLYSTRIRTPQVLYPALMFVGVCRTMLVRVYSKATIEFRWLPDEDETGRGCMSRSFMSWRHDHSFFSWGDKGQWETVQTSNEDIWRKRNWFRIGFEPVFVDFTQSGACFTIIFLVEVSEI